MMNNIFTQLRMQLLLSFIFAWENVHRDACLGFTPIEAVDTDIFHQIRFQVDLSGLKR